MDFVSDILMQISNVKTLSVLTPCYLVCVAEGEVCRLLTGHSMPNLPYTLLTQIIPEDV